jgi:hypothetical protein
MQGKNTGLVITVGYNKSFKVRRCSQTFLAIFVRTKAAHCFAK